MTTVTSRAINNPNGTIDFNDYLPPVSRVFNYTSIRRFLGSEETQDTEIVNIEVTDNVIRELGFNGETDTEYTIEPNRVRITSFDLDEDGNLQRDHDFTFGRFFNVGDQIGTTSFTGASEFTFGDNATTITSDFEQNCSLDDALTFFLRENSVILAILSSSNVILLAH